MKRILSFILATAMLAAFIPSAFAEGEEATQTQNLKVTYAVADKSKPLSATNTTVSYTLLTEEISDGFFRYNSDTSSGVYVRAGRGTPEYNGVELSAGKYVSLDIYVPVAGAYVMTVKYPKWSSGGKVEVYVNDAEVAVGSYDCAGESTVTNNYKSGNIDSDPITGVNLKEGWNKLKFSTVTSNKQGTVRNFTLTLGDGSGYALMGIREAELDVGATKEIKTFKSSDATEITENLAYISANDAVAKVENGVITAVANGKTTITVSDGTGVPYDINVTVNDPSMPMIKYDFQSFFENTYETDNNSSGLPIADITEDRTKGFFRLKGSSNTKPTLWNYTYDEYSHVNIGSTLYIELEVYVPIAGTYTMNMTHSGYQEYKKEIELFVNGSATPVGSYSSYLEGIDKRYKAVKTSEIQGVSLNKGWNTLKFRAQSDGSGSVASFTLSAGTGDALMPYVEGGSTLEIGETARLSGFLSSTATAVDDETYSVEGDAVTVGTDGTITAVAPGKATVTMATEAATATAGNTCTVDITVPDKETSFVSIGIDYGDDSGVKIEEAALGEEITVTAADRDNMVFRGWVRGSAENGHLVWTEPEYTFVATTHTYLTAIYTAKVEGETNEYYHWNGQFLGNDKTEAEANISPIVGYTFAKSWRAAKTENTITSWIAEFDKNSTEYDVSGDTGFTITKADSKYDTEVTCTSDNGAVYWYRDGKLVDYGTEYKFFIWDDTTITTSNDGHNGAKLMLDKKKDNTYMVEYDAGDATLLEVGILFGDTGETPTVESCKEKMSSQRNINEKGHGQFSATSERAVARGYLVYEDGDTYRVIYAD